MSGWMHRIDRDGDRLSVWMFSRPSQKKAVAIVKRSSILKLGEVAELAPGQEDKVDTVMFIVSNPLAARVAEWAAHRAKLSAAEESERPPSASDWADSDDAAAHMLTEIGRSQGWIEVE